MPKNSNDENLITIPFNKTFVCQNETLRIFFFFVGHVTQITCTFIDHVTTDEDNDALSYPLYERTLYQPSNVRAKSRHGFLIKYFILNLKAMAHIHCNTA